MSDATPSGGEKTWTPTMTVDVLAATQHVFDEKAREFYRLNKDRPLRPNILTTGWHEITPEIAEELLLSKANRKISFLHVQYLARQMLEGAWIPTGQPAIVTADGVLRDAYHRCWACYLSGVSFRTFVVTDVPVNDYIFAYIDNGKPRSPADGLQTAGFNGIAASIAATVRIATRHRLGGYEPHRRMVIPRMTPIEMIRFVEAHPTLQDAVNDILSNYKDLLHDLTPRKKDVICYVGWQIRDLYGEDVMENFFLDLGDDSNTSGAIGLLRSKLLGDVDGRAKLSSKEVLAFLIKTFNSWQSGRSMRRLILGTDESFPKLNVPEPPDEEPAEHFRQETNALSLAS